MKKLALAALLSVPMLAMAQNGYYIQGDVGFSRPKVETGGRKLNGNEVLMVLLWVNSYKIMLVLKQIILIMAKQVR